MLIDHLSIIGVGLIGGSLARALRKQNACGHITGYGRSSEHLQEAVDLGVIDNFSLSMGSAVKSADLIVLATPLITDVGSAKGSVVEAAHATLDDFLPRFVPGHPIAGKEKSGVSASTADLFQSHRVILTPLPETSVSAIDKIRQMWELCGAEVVQLGVKQHDEILAATSHLPHMLAYALVDCLAGMRERDEIFRFAAGGFADFTRIASSDPQM
ncbi:MAG: prephenate dehydrogenase/arogenate dehydrogenase family protein, partial [Gammaproteobacteria bacterium]